MSISITPKESRRVNALLRRLCANYDAGSCLLLDDDEACPCIQEISCYRIYCNYFKHAVLPADRALYAELMQPQGKKRCARCGKAFTPGSNRQKYCPACGEEERRKKDRLRKRRKRHSSVRI